MLRASFVDARTDAALRRLKLDRRSGATALTRRLLAALELSVGHVMTHEDWPNRLRALARSVKQTQPAMGAFQRWAGYLSRAARHPGHARVAEELRRQIGRERASLAHERERAVAAAVAHLPKDAQVLTLSRSDLVEKTLARAMREGRLGSVIVSESLPGGEGRALAASLERRGIPARWVRDSVARRVVRTVDLVLIGADAVYGDGGVVHKVGTRRLATAAFRARVPVYVVTGSSKWTHRKHPPSRLPRQYDVTPGHHVAGFWTDRRHREIS